MTTTKYWIAAMACVALGISSCSKDKHETTVTATDTVYNKLITVTNFAGDTSDTDHTKFYFSLEKERPAPGDSLLTKGWDVSFSGTFNTSIGGNFGADDATGTSFGKGGTGAGGVLIVTKPFAEVTQVPADSVFSTKAAAFGLDAAGFAGSGIGWAVYDFAGNLRATLGFGGNGATQAHTVWARPDRTIIVRTTAGNYAKVQIISLYKDAPTEPTTKDAAPYFTFQYVIAKPGTKDFTIK